MPNQLNKNLRLKFREPAICESRGQRRLLVWGELGQWMVVDDELLALCRAFSSAVTPEEAIACFANTQGKNPRDVDTEALPAIEHLAERNILATPPLVDPTPTEPHLSIENKTINITNH